MVDFTFCVFHLNNKKEPHSRQLTRVQNPLYRVREEKNLKTRQNANTVRDEEEREKLSDPWLLSLQLSEADLPQPSGSGGNAYTASPPCCLHHC